MHKITGATRVSRLGAGLARSMFRNEERHHFGCGVKARLSLPYFFELCIYQEGLVLSQSKGEEEHIEN